MANDNIKELTEDELEMVAGGAKYNIAYVTQLENGKYQVDKYSFDGDEDTFKKFMSGAAVSSLNVSISTSSGVIGADKIDLFLERQKKRGFEIIMK